jgi:hypothetical protein
MTKNYVLASLIAAAAATGCTATVNGTVTPGASTSPGASLAPSTASSTAPGGTASATPAASASPGATASTGVADAAMLKIYKAGRKWVYELSTAGMTIDTTQEVVKIEGATATIKTTSTVMGRTSDSTSTVDLSKTDYPTMVSKQVASGNSNTSYTWQQTSTGAESVTVPAGTYAATKWVGKLIAAGMVTGAVKGASTADVDMTFWTSTDVGLVKLDGVSKNTTSVSTYQVKQQMPDLSQIPGMGGTGMPTGIPAGIGGATSSTFTYKMTLKSVTP